MKLPHSLETGLKQPGSPRSFFMPEGYISYDKPMDNRIFTFLLGGTSSERWSAACLNVFLPSSFHNETRYIPEGIILLSPFNNLNQLRDILTNFLKNDYSTFALADSSTKHQYLQNLLNKSTNVSVYDCPAIHP